MEMKKYYSEEYRREMLELSDRHIDWDFGHAIKPTSDEDMVGVRYEISKRMYTDDFENHYHVKLRFCGRSGRHVCVEETAENRRRYAVMCDAVELMQKLIVLAATNNSEYFGDVFGLFEKIPQWISRVHRENKRELDERYPLNKC